ncbi:FAD-dependent oxidoreductase [Aspergillus glaucus CBS 516.65]|uniref:FAD-binding FR-type domain-containing protein n=1 Tax=Aspergillus glaucus CBS 516.65 TaxID=1160497 RepID=A0A1L9VDW4_ASPGL|nr:hypothetical protein ASPGLDRAFT_68071 [Aspergillus glaucus CBS 516.65]OJJ82094.1 hypothetical protein ASPGLDRAFT_68071 [Aspergillus glaucus CBS 516.65]
MSSKPKTGVPHQVRTAAEPRQNRLFTVRLTHIDELNPTVRLLQLTIPPNVQSLENDIQDGDEDKTPQPLTFLPGQWLDVHIPTIPNAGGFSITSTPADANVLPIPEQPPKEHFDSVAEPGLPPVDSAGRPPYVELAVQKALSNPASAWLWKPKDEILGTELGIRVGGGFVWPPSGIDLNDVRNVVLIAGGVGINPLISILSHLNNNESNTVLPNPTNIQVLYSTRLPDPTPSSTETTLDQILFLSRLRHITQSQCQSHRLRIGLDLFITDLPDNSPLRTAPPVDISIHPRRISREDLGVVVKGADGSVRPEETVCYLCGPLGMTDEFDGILRGLLGDGQERIFFEKWW